jgi:hypothetical protein
MISGRLEVVSAFIAGACLVALFVVASGPQAPVPTLAEKKAALRSAAKMTQLTESFHSDWPATRISDNTAAEGNLGGNWNYGQNYGGSNANAVTRGWTSGADTVHSGGKGMFGTFGVDPTEGAFQCPEELPDSFTGYTWIMAAFGDDCNDGCASAGLTCDGSFPLPTSATQADCLFEAAGERCSAEDEENSVDDLMGGGWGANPSYDSGTCYWNHGNGQCGTSSYSGAQRLCGCKETR